MRQSTCACRAPQAIPASSLNASVRPSLPPDVAHSLEPAPAPFPTCPRGMIFPMI
jgi:hypothetical protein